MILKSRQVNLDPLPYVDQHGSTRSPDGDPAGHDFDARFYYEPRPEFEPTRDPKPWAHRAYGDRSEFSLNSFVWAPRREEFDTPVNRILVAFRQHAGKATLPDHARLWLDVSADAEEWEPFTSAEVEHARRVLTRLATREEA